MNSRFSWYWFIESSAWIKSLLFSSFKFRGFRYLLGKYSISRTLKENKMADQDFIYRISTDQEWQEFQKKGSSLGGELDKSTGCFHLSKLEQVSLSLSPKDLHFFFNMGVKKINTFMMIITSPIRFFPRCKWHCRTSSWTLRRIFTFFKSTLTRFVYDDVDSIYIYHLIWHIHVVDHLEIKNRLFWWVVDL